MHCLLVAARSPGTTRYVLGTRTSTRYLVHGTEPEQEGNLGLWHLFVSLLPFSSLLLFFSASPSPRLASAKASFLLLLHRLSLFASPVQTLASSLLAFLPRIVDSPRLPLPLPAHQRSDPLVVQPQTFRSIRQGVACLPLSCLTTASSTFFFFLLWPSNRILFSHIQHRFEPESGGFNTLKRHTLATDFPVCVYLNLSCCLHSKQSNTLDKMRPTATLMRLALCLSSAAPLVSAWPGWLPELDALVVRADKGSGMY